MFDITSKYFSLFDNKPPTGWIAHIARDFLTCYSCLYYISMIKTRPIGPFHMWRYIQLTLLYSFFWPLITSILVKNSWKICLVKFYQRNKHRVKYFRYFSTLIRKCAWRYVQWIIEHFVGYDDINKNSFKMKKL